MFFNVHFVIKVNIEPKFTIDLYALIGYIYYYDYCIKQLIQIKQLTQYTQWGYIKMFVLVTIFSAAAFFQKPYITHNTI